MLACFILRVPAPCFHCVKDAINVVQDELALIALRVKHDNKPRKTSFILAVETAIKLSEEV